MSGSFVTSYRVDTISASDRSTWIFVTLALANGAHGIGEATLDHREGVVVARLEALASTLVREKVAAEDAAGILPAIDGDLATAAAIAAIDQALADALARAAGLSLADFIGGELRQEVGLYANVNRGTRDRSPAGFASGASLAKAAGFDAIKIAPFDEVQPRAPAAQSMKEGLARIAAVRDVLGQDGRLMIDCHWRFDERTAGMMIDACRGFNPYWIECPLPENGSQMAAIAALRRQANRNGILLAGGENAIGLDGIEAFLAADAYDVIMPDVKYVGGPRTMLEAAARLRQAGITFSPHNPSGPVAYAASLEVCAAAPTVDLLEYQFAETPLFDTMVFGAIPAIRGGVAHLSAMRQGIGLELRPS
ncbi:MULTISPECIES: enolase C-terminal domain-like protein [unclassified Chelatococcus]|uniref:enolase C-terminal domain-like protein n=1 Tax=unclassified Chelatococcus TaxID=2638111 RepID=UPI001BCD9251|nr:MULTISPECIES: enolase C-terminal domain-like protein [unclassified Chelatococcus]MBS7700361.1 hypothetical protein [Chelatococcus sp. YT9]MBX3556157.1 hypothetical protein [Chelatococcus sp.]